ncbi:matrix metalloproteinase-14-like [Argopecten irradians]|uniref:matrix metalloproteinase-14-like n=1 Tax=Argopecten irradians TaxID=31199 RepID=UPI00370FECDE
MKGCNIFVLGGLFLVNVVLLPILAAVIPDTRTSNTGNGNGVKSRVHRHHMHPSKLSMAEGYLLKYGYLDNERHVYRKQRREAILSFQHFNGLRETGRLNRRTVQKMAEPRCGIPDDVHPDLQRRRKRQTSYGPGWKQNIITWRPVKFSQKMPRYKQWKTFKTAFMIWSRVIPRYFKFTIDNPDIVIKFARGIHGDGYYNGFDGRGMTLAHAFRPGPQPLSGDTHFDDDEDWSRDGRGNMTNPDLLAVAIHEFGHAIGLDHSAEYNSVMSAFFSARRTELTQKDIFAVQSIYGSKPIPPVRRNVVTRTSNRPTISSTTRSRPNYRPDTTTAAPRPTLNKLSSCQDVDATFIGNDGFISIIVNDTLFQADRRSGNRKSLALRSVYPDAPIPVGAATYFKGRTYLFKDSYVWRYTKQKLDYGFPKKVLTHENGESPRAAVSIKGYRNRRIYLFGKTKFWEWSVWHDDVIGRRQYDINKFWKGVPDSPDAAVTWADQAIYFLKDDMYYKVSQRTRRLSRRFPQRMPAPWMRDVCDRK